MVDTKVTCDECGVAKREVNHWLLAAPFERTTTHLLIAKWNDRFADEGVHHYCGRECFNKAQSRWLDTGSLDKPQLQEPARFI